LADKPAFSKSGRFQGLDFSDSDNFDSKFETLITALDTDLAWVEMHNPAPHAHFANGNVILSNDGFPIR
jgi:hypothetical protein